MPEQEANILLQVLIFVTVITSIVLAQILLDWISKPTTWLWHSGIIRAPASRDIVNWNSCQLTKLEYVERYTSMRMFSCSNNQIASLNGLQYCTQLQVLHIERNCIESLRGIGLCINLKELHCGGNSLTTLEGIEGCINLEILYCSSNMLTDITSNAWPRLKRLDLSHNPLVGLESITSCVSIEYLNIAHTGLTTLEGLGLCPRLKTLNCSANALTSIDGLNGSTSLVHLDCGFNQLVSLDGIETCFRLETLHCSHNLLTSLDPLLRLQRLQSVCYRFNPLDTHTEPFRCLMLMLEMREQGIHRTRLTIYADGQNAHDGHVQKSVCDSVQALMHDPKPMCVNVMTLDLEASIKELLVIYCRDTTSHSVCHITYAQLLAYVWQRICRSEHRAELVKILAEQVWASRGKCFTGRFNRLLSVLVGFSDDISITIGDSSRIGAVIVATREKIQPYCALAHRQLVQQQLLDLGYSNEEIHVWLEAITDMN